MSFFTASGITAGYKQQPVLRDLSFELSAGSITGLLGANGSGKTTLLKAICGMIPHSGTCTLNGTALEDLTAKQLAALCSYIPQRSGISIDISALDVVLMGFNPQLRLLEQPNDAMKEKARQALALVGLKDREHTNYLHFSEGQKQLCILARTLAANSSLLLLDEPESALDFHYRYHMLELLQQWIHSKERGALITLHDPTLALNYCDHILLLSEGQIIGTLSPRLDPLPQMEELLQTIYGPVSLQLCQNRSGQEQLVLLRERS